MLRKAEEEMESKKSAEAEKEARLVRLRAEDEKKQAEKEAAQREIDVAAEKERLLAERNGTELACCFDTHGQRVRMLKTTLRPRNEDSEN